MQSELPGRGVRGVVMALALSAAGCASDQVSPEVMAPPNRFPIPFPWAKVYAATHGNLYIASYNQSAGTRSSSYQVGGNVYASSAGKHNVNGGVMTSGGVNVTPYYDAVYYSVNQPVFGAVSTWGLSGNPALGIPAFTDSMYVPAEITLMQPAPGVVISRTSPMPVTWTPDPLNDSVVVIFGYDESISRFADSTNPTMQYGRFYITPDDGSFTVPASDLSGLPPGGYMNLYVARGRGKLTGTPARRYYIYGTTTAAGLYKVSP